MPKQPEFVEKFEYTPTVVRNAFIRFFGGLRLGLTVLALILTATTVGEFLPQDEGSNLALDKVFHARWYHILLVLLALNLVLNTYITYVEKTYPQFLPIFRKNPDSFKPLKVKHKSTFKETSAADGRAMMSSLGQSLRSRGYRCFYDGRALYAHRGLLARFGSSITHLGLITIILAALIEVTFKVEGNVLVIEGETVGEYYLPDETFQSPPSHSLGGVKVKVHDFEFTQYPGTGVASKYKSTITFSGKSKEPVYDYVRVNHDVSYGGWAFHQNSYIELQERSGLGRYFIALAETKPDGSQRLHRLESYLVTGETEITPIPGEEDRFLILETDASGRGLIWSVASKREILSRGHQSLFGDLRIEMLDFYPHFSIPSDLGFPINIDDEPESPSAQIELSQDNTVLYRGWVHEEGSPYGRVPGSEAPLIDLVLLDFDIPPMGGGDGSEVADRVTAMVSLRSPDTGLPVGEQYRLARGRSVSLTGGADPRYSIEGPFVLEEFQKITGYATVLSASRNPGIPIAWIGAVFATMGPIIAFFVSRRRIWASVDWKKKTLWIGGDSRYSREALEDEIAETLGEWSRSDTIRMTPPIRMAGSGSSEVLSRHL